MADEAEYIGDCACCQRRVLIGECVGGFLLCCPCLVWWDASAAAANYRAGRVSEASAAAHFVSGMSCYHRVLLARLPAEERN
jgi:hypothetical protein